MFKLVVSDRAEKDFDKIITYIAEELDSPQAAGNFSDKVHECYLRLKENPFIHAECQDPRLKKDGFRRAVINNYIMLFKIIEEQKSVWIYRFFHSKQDYVNLI
jgi:plasmid stabilization system protein ParE